MDNRKEVPKEQVKEENNKLENFLKEVGHGEIKVMINDGKLFAVPKQIIDRPAKAGVRVHIVVDEPIYLKAA